LQRLAKHHIQPESVSSRISKFGLSKSFASTHYVFFSHQDLRTPRFRKAPGKFSTCLQAALASFKEISGVNAFFTRASRCASTELSETLSYSLPEFQQGLLETPETNRARALFCFIFKPNFTI